MNPQYHIIFGLIFSLILLFIFPQIGILGFSIIFFSSFLIDVDHYIYYVYRKKDWSLKNAYNWFVENKKKYKKLSKIKRKQLYPPLCFIHTIEIFLIMSFLSMFSIIFLFLLTGFIFHLFLDMFNALYDNMNGHDISVIYNLLKSKKFKNIEDI